MHSDEPTFRRRAFLGAAIAFAAGAATQPTGNLFAQGARAPAPGCKPGSETPAQTEGPFYTQRTPQRTSFRGDVRADVRAELIVLEGQVLDAQCVPIAGAWLDFWHADAEGEYDNSGFRMRGHQYTDAAGRYRLETILPALYPGRARHIHVKLRGPSKLSSSEGQRVLTTQVYFPEDPGNARDRLVRPELTARRADNLLRLDFVLRA